MERYLIVILAALVVLVIIFALWMGAAPAIALVIGALLGSTTWIYDKLQTRNALLSRRFRVQTVYDVLTDIARNRMPALMTDSTSVRDGASESRIRSLMTLSEFLDDPLYSSMDAVEDIADMVIQDHFSHSASVEGLGTEVLRTTLLYLASASLVSPFKNAAASSAKSFVWDQVRFEDTGPPLTQGGDKFLKTVSFLRIHQGILDLDLFHKHMGKDLKASERDKLTIEFSDPQLGFLVKELGKAHDLVELVQREMSGKRLMGRLAKRMRAGSWGAEPRYDTFLVVKQEKGERSGGERYLENQIGDIPNRIVAAGWIYNQGNDKAKGFQSVNIVRVNSAYADAKEFVDDHFPSVENLHERELQRIGLVAMPIVTSKAYYYPEDHSVLRAANRDHYERWTKMFGKEQKALRKMFADFNITFIDVVDHLTIDFLVRDIPVSEAEYLRERTDSVFARLGIKNLLDLARVRPNLLAETLRSLGYPSYRTSDISESLESYTVPLQKFLDDRIDQIAQESVKNAKKILNLRKPSGPQ